MIIIYDNEGTVIETSNPVLYQGDASLGRIYVVAPYPNNAAFTMSFTLPNGFRTKEYMLVRDYSSSEIKSNMLVFKLNTPSNVFSVLSGQVEISVYCYLPKSVANPDLITPNDANTWSEKRAFDSTMLTIIKGAYPTLDGTAPSTDAWGDIVGAVGQLSGTLQSVINNVELNIYTEEILTSSWASTSNDYAPYQYAATIYFSPADSGANYIELINNNALLFARYGFAIFKPENDNNLIMLSVARPTEDITFKIGWRKIGNV